MSSERFQKKKKKKNKEGLGKKTELGDTQSDDEICLSKKLETFDLVKNQETTRQDEERQEKSQN